MYKNVILNNNIASFLFSLLLCFVSLVIYGAGEPGFIRIVHFPYIELLIGILFLIAYFAFGYFVLKDAGSVLNNLISVLFISFFACAGFILSDIGSLFMLFVHPLLPFEPEETWEGIFSIRFLCILVAPSLLLWTGLGFKNNKKLYLALFLILVSVLISPSILERYDNNRVLKLTEYEETAIIKVDEQIPMSSYAEAFGLTYGVSSDHYDWLDIESIIWIEDEHTKKHFEESLGIKLPETDFINNYLFIARGEKYTWEHGELRFKESVGNNTLVVYKVNVVTPLFSQ